MNLETLLHLDRLQRESTYRARLVRAESEYRRAEAEVAWIITTVLLFLVFAVAI